MPARIRSCSASSTRARNPGPIEVARQLSNRLLRSPRLAGGTERKPGTTASTAHGRNAAGHRDRICFAPVRRRLRVESSLRAAADGEHWAPVSHGERGPGDGRTSRDPAPRSAVMGHPGEELDAAKGPGSIRRCRGGTAAAAQRLGPRIPAPGRASAVFTATRIGGATVTAETDYACRHVGPQCELPQRVFSLAVRVLPPAGQGAGPLPQPAHG